MKKSIIVITILMSLVTLAVTGYARQKPDPIKTWYRIDRVMIDGHKYLVMNDRYNGSGGITHAADCQNPEFKGQH